MSEEQARLQAEMNNKEFREEFGKLLNAAKEKENLGWKELAKALSQTGEDVADHVRNAAAGKVLPWVPLVRSTVRYCTSAGVPIPERFSIYRLKDRQPTPESAPVSALVTVLGLESKKSEESLNEYHGRWLLFTLDEKAKVIVSTYLLSREVGNDGSPIFLGKRKRSEDSIQYFLGGYFANEKQLYLIGTPEKSIELRLAIFHVLPAVDQKKLRGVILRVSGNSVLSTRAMLIRATEFEIDVRLKVCTGSHEQSALIVRGNKDIADYLYGVENPPYIKNTSVPPFIISTASE